jgi:hypothetical protein
MSQSYRPLWLSPLVLIAFLVAGSGLVVGLGMTWASGTETGATGSDYIAEHVDSICGLDDVRVLSNERDRREAAHAGGEHRPDVGAGPGS